MSKDQYELVKLIIKTIMKMDYGMQLELAGKLGLIPLPNGENNKRKHPRKEVFIPADIKVDDKKVIDFIGDISTGGVFIRSTTTPFYMGQVVELDFTYDGTDHVNIKGQVVRVADNGIGIKFVKK